MSNQKKPLRKANAAPPSTKHYDATNNLQVGNRHRPVPTQEEQKATRKLTVAQSQSFFSGPIPQPLMLKQYEEILPGSAERIFAMAEKEAEHIRLMDAAVLDAQKGDNRRGQWLAFGVCTLMAAVGITALILNHPVTASIVCGSTLTGLVAVFITGRTGTNKQDENKESSQEDSKQVATVPPEKQE